MADITKRLAAPDSRGRIVSIFVGAVLLPSIALSVVSFNAVPKQAENLKLSLLRQAEQLLYYVEEDLEQATRKKALEAARAVDPEVLLEGRAETVRRALAEAGLAQIGFDSLRLEAWSRTGSSPASDRKSAEMAALSAALSGRPSRPQPRDEGEEDAVPLTTAGGEELGVVRFRFSCDYAHRQIVQEFFETGFANPGGAWVIRVSEPTGELLYENASTKSGERFEVERVMAAPSFEGVRLQLRYRDRSIEEEVRRLAIAKTCADRLHRPDAAGRARPGVEQRPARAAPLAAQERLRRQRQPRAQDAARARSGSSPRRSSWGASRARSARASTIA